MASRRSSDPKATAHSIEAWLLESTAQLGDGPHRGGVAGRVAVDGRPEYVYLEITGYYLTAMAWLAGRKAATDPRAALAIERGRGALDWLEAMTADGAVPATRIHLANAADDWRNRARFSFDLAMAARGVACFGRVAESERAAAIAGALARRLGEVGGGGRILASHAPLDGDHLPERWSTRPGPHHIKAAAAVLRLPPGLADEALLRRCRQTVSFWTDAMRASWPCRELHPLLYGLEGLLLLESNAGPSTLASVELLYDRLMTLQAPDGSLPANVDRSGAPRADVQAQALRIGAILRSARHLQGEKHRRRGDALADALAAHVRSDGSVAFWVGQGEANTWCAMFAQQALSLHAGGADGAAPAPDAELLI